MKRFWQAYISFTRTERMGIITLLAVVITLVIVKATMHLWVHPVYDTAQEQKLVREWQTYQAGAERQQTTYPCQSKQYHSTSSTTTSSENNKAVKETNGQLFNFDPNTVDSISLRKLGLKEKTTAIFLHWRAKGKRFYHKEELKKLYTLTPEEYERLEPYIVIDKNSAE